MREQIFSSSWYRVSELRPQLRAHARVHRHVYRGKPWFVLEDVINQRVHRLTPSTQAIIGLMDGERRLGEIWEIASETLADEAPTQDEVIQLMSQLHASDVLQCDVPPDTEELLERYEAVEKRALQGRLLSPFAIKIPLFDPDELLRKVTPFLKPLFGRFGLALWLCVVVPALVIVGLRWSELTEGVLDRVLAPQNLVLLWLLFPVIKLVHEFAHGIAVRVLGAEVHEMGVMLLVFTPIPYVNASSASAFPDRYHRALVAAAGVIAEAVIAALAVYLWSVSQPGLVRMLAFNTMLIAGVTTLTFNLNPLLRFDGYYAMADLLEIPNLRQRSNDYLSYLIERYAFGSPDAAEPDVDAVERVWLASYGIAAFLYRMLVIAFIVFFVLDISIVLGVVLAAVSAIGWIGMPLTKLVRHVLTHPRLQRVRQRAVLTSVGAVLLLIFVLVVLPLPYRTQVEGVVWMSDETFVRANTAGFVEEVLAEPGALVEAGTPLFKCRDLDLETYVAVLEPRHRVLKVQEKRAAREDLAGARIYAERIRHLEQRLARARERSDGLVVRSHTGGRLVAPQPEELIGRFVNQGDMLAYVVEPGRLRVRAVVPQEEIELVTERLVGVQVRLAERIDEVLPAVLTRIVPAARADLPSIALGSRGGGSLPVDPRRQDGSLALASLIEVDLELERPPGMATAGGRVFVRFDHGFESLASRWVRSVRQLFLSRLNV